MNTKTFEDVVVGDETRFTVCISKELVDSFANLSGDFNPLHMDSVYAKESGFTDRIPHGMIAGALFSRLVGVEYPGRFALYLSQTLQFKNPMTIGHCVLVSGSVLQKIDAHHTLRMKTTVCDVDTGTPLVEGEALVKILRKTPDYV